MQITKKISAEFTKLKEMPAQDRLWYIWEYYKLHIAVTAFVLVCVISLLCTLFSPEKTYLHNAAINLTSVTASESDGLTTKIQESMGLDQYDTISVSSLYMTVEEDFMAEQQMALLSLQVMIATQELDLLMLPQTDFDALAKMDIYCNIQQLLPPELWQTVQDKAIYVTDPVTGQTYPAALEITQCPLIQSCQFITDSVVVCFSPTCQRIDNGVALIAHLFGQ